MAIISGLFNSVSGDPRRYDAKWFARYFALFIGNGVFPNPSTGLQVTESANMRTVVKPGDGWINGYFIVNDSDYVLQHDVADGVLKRIDRVVMRLNYLSRQIEIAIKKGAPASSPVAPSLQRDADVHELALADVFINNGATVISQASITDQRLNKALCGIVHGTVNQVDTTTIFNQYQSWFGEFTDEKQIEFEAWLDDLKDILDGDVAANLANRIATLEGRVTTLDNKVDTLDGKIIAVEQSNATHLADFASHPILAQPVSVTGGILTVKPLTPVSGTHEGLGYATGLVFIPGWSGTDTGGLKIKIEGLAGNPIPVLKSNNNPLTKWYGGSMYTLRFFGGNFFLQGEGGEYGTAAAPQVLQGYTVGTENGVVPGTLIPGKKWAIGSGGTFAPSQNTIEISLPFTPSTAIVYASNFSLSPGVVAGGVTFNNYDMQVTIKTNGLVVKSLGQNTAGKSSFYHVYE